MTRKNNESAETSATTAGAVYRQARDHAASQAEYDLEGGLERLTHWMQQDKPDGRPISSAVPASQSFQSHLAVGLPHYRAIIALDIESSTRRPVPVKSELRNKIYELFEAALRQAGITARHRDRFVDRGDGILALIHPVDQAPKAVLLNRAVPVLSRLLADYNASLPRYSQPERQLRVRVVVHAGEVHYDANGCFGEALDVAFRLLDAVRVKRALRETADPLVLVVSGDIYNSVVRHGFGGIDQQAFHPLVRVKVAGQRYPGWIHFPEQATRLRLADLTGERASWQGSAS